MSRRAHFGLFLLALCSFGVFFMDFARAEDGKPDNDGYIRNWLLLAPIPVGEENAGADAIDKQQIKDEAKLDPREGEKIKVENKEYTWKAVKAKDFALDVNEVLGNQTEDSIAYAVAYIKCDKEMTGLTLWMGSNDEGKVYLNGKEVVKSTESRALEQDTDKAENVTLKKGVNILVFKLINEKNNWQGCIRFKNKDAVVKDFTVQTNP